MLDWLRHPTVQIVSALITIYSAVIAIVSWLIKNVPEWVGKMTWPQAILSGIGLVTLFALVSGVALFLGGFGWRRIWPLSAPELASSQPDSAALIDQIRPLLDRVKRIEEQKSETRVVEGIGDAGPAWKAAFKELEGKISEFDSAVEQVAANIITLQQEINRHLTKMDGRITAIGKRIDDISEGFARRFGRHNVALLAIYHREQLAALKGPIIEIADRLRAAFAKGQVQTADEWEVWQIAYVEWRSKVAAWLKIALMYRSDADEVVGKIDPNLLGGDWSVEASQFPTGNAGFNVFKIFCINSRNWDDLRDSVEDLVRRVAFEGVDINNA